MRLNTEEALYFTAACAGYTFGHPDTHFEVYIRMTDGSHLHRYVKNSTTAHAWSRYFHRHPHRYGIRILHETSVQRDFPIGLRLDIDLIARPDRSPEIQAGLEALKAEILEEFREKRRVARAEKRAVTPF